MRIRSPFWASFFIAGTEIAISLTHIFVKDRYKDMETLMTISLVVVVSIEVLAELNLTSADDQDRADTLVHSFGEEFHEALNAKTPYIYTHPTEICERVWAIVVPDGLPIQICDLIGYGMENYSCFKSSRSVALHKVNL